MAATEAFEIKLTGGSVRGVLQRPDATTPDSPPPPCVLVCRGIDAPSDEASSFADELIEALCKSGLTVARFEHRCAELILEDFDAHCARNDVEDALAAFDWLAARPDIDPALIGVIGYSLGAIAATGLARQRPTIARLALLAATTANHLANHLVKGNGSPPLIDPNRLPTSYISSLSEIDSPTEAVSLDRPTLIIHGAADQFTPPQVSWTYLEAFESAERRVEHVLVARGNHVFSLPAARTTCLNRITRFFESMTEDRDAAIAAKSSA